VAVCNAVAYAVQRAADHTAEFLRAPGPGWPPRTAVRRGANSIPVPKIT
jgi:hypothetical protein